MIKSFAYPKHGSLDVLGEIHREQFDAAFGAGWPEVPCRRWEYPLAAAAGMSGGPVRRVLECGCGRQLTFARYLANVLDLQVDAIDTIPDLPSVGNKWLNTMTASMIDLPYNNNQFDVVFAISSIEHINAGRFAIPHLAPDTGDGLAMSEMLRVLRPGGRLVLTTDIAPAYIPPPGLWPSGSHRIYSWSAIEDRLLDGQPCAWDGEIDVELPADLTAAEPKGYDYTVALLTLIKIAGRYENQGL